MNLLLTPWLKASLSVLPPSPAAIGSLGLHCFVLQTRVAESFSCLAASPLFRRAAPRRGPHDSTSHEPPATALHGFPASFHASPRPSRLTSRDSAFPRGPLAASPAFTCCASARSSTCFRTQVLCVVCSPLSSLSRSSGPPARLCELTVLNTHTHTPLHAAGGVRVLQRRSHPIHALHVEAVDSMSIALAWEATPPTGHPSSGLAGSED